MTSPITHEKIIEVLRTALTAIDAMRYVNRGTVSPENAFAQFNMLNKQACEVYDIARTALDAARYLYQRLQAEKEGGDVASANAGTGRAVDEHPLKRAMAIVVGAIGEPTGLITLNMHAHLQREIAEALASEHQRGLAEGERIGIEKAAKYLESLIGPNDNSVSVRMADLGSMANHIRQRALTGDPQT